MKKKQQLLTQMNNNIDNIIKNIELLMHINKIRYENFNRCGNENAQQKSHSLLYSKD